jgi:hypothetical protein
LDLVTGGLVAVSDGSFDTVEYERQLAEGV